MGISAAVGGFHHSTLARGAEAVGQFETFQGLMEERSREERLES